MSDNPLSQLTREQLESVLVQYIDVCDRLWPYVRFFGLFGGESAAISAVHDLAVLQGRKERTVDDNLAKAAYAKAIDDVLALFNEKYSRKMMEKDRRPFLEDLSSLR